MVRFVRIISTAPIAETMDRRAANKIQVGDVGVVVEEEEEEDLIIVLLVGEDMIGVAMETEEDETIVRGATIIGTREVTTTA